MKIFIYEDKLDEYIAEQREVLTAMKLTPSEIEDRLARHLKYYVVIKYSKEWQDKHLNYWLDRIKTAEGYWQAQEAILQPHCEFSHYRLRSQMSYEKGNVSNTRAKAELIDKDYQQYVDFKRFRGEIVPELEIDLEIEAKVYKGAGGV